MQLAAQDELERHAGQVSDTDNKTIIARDTDNNGMPAR